MKQNETEGIALPFFLAKVRYTVIAGKFVWFVVRNEDISLPEKQIWRPWTSRQEYYSSQIMPLMAAEKSMFTPTTTRMWSNMSGTMNI